MRLTLLSYTKKSNPLPKKKEKIRKPGKNEEIGKQNKLKTA